jgi:DnaK suppressor protein
MNTELLKQKLEEEKVKIESEMEKIGQRNPAVPNDWETAPEELGIEADLVDQADIIIDRENTSAIFADLEARYDTILEALHRIEKGIYGICEVCQAPIEEPRLNADPSAMTCIEHK